MKYSWPECKSLRCGGKPFGIGRPCRKYYRRIDCDKSSYKQISLDDYRYGIIPASHWSGISLSCKSILLLHRTVGFFCSHTSDCQHFFSLWLIYYSAAHAAKHGWKGYVLCCYNYSLFATNQPNLIRNRL